MPCDKNSSASNVPCAGSAAPQATRSNVQKGHRKIPMPFGLSLLPTLLHPTGSKVQGEKHKAVYKGFAAFYKSIISCVPSALHQQWPAAHAHSDGTAW
jgi:hypothetical protein